MKKELSKKEAKMIVEKFFEKQTFLPGETKKIKRLAMKYKIRLGKHRKRFCQECYANLREGKIRITKEHKTVECLKCKHKNKFRIAKKDST